MTEKEKKTLEDNVKRELTAEQEARFEYYVDKYVKIATKQATDSEITEAIHKLYALADLDTSDTSELDVIIVDNPFEAQLVANIIYGDKVRDKVMEKVMEKVRNKVYAEAWEKVRTKVRHKIYAKVWAEVDARVSNEVYAEAWDKVYAKVSNKVYAKVWENVSYKVRNKVWDEVGLEYFDFGYYCNYSDYGWTAFYEFFESETEINYDDIPEWQIWKSIIDTGIYETIQFEKLCIAVKNPLKIIYDKHDNVSCYTEAAVQFRDYEYYVIDVIDSEYYESDSEIAELIRTFADERKVRAMLRLQTVEGGRGQ